MPMASGVRSGSAGAQAPHTADTAAITAVPAAARGENPPLSARYCWGAPPAAAAAIMSRAWGAESGSQSTS